MRCLWGPEVLHNRRKVEMRGSVYKPLAGSSPCSKGDIDYWRALSAVCQTPILHVLHCLRQAQSKSQEQKPYVHVIYIERAMDIIKLTNQEVKYKWGRARLSLSSGAVRAYQAPLNWVGIFYIFTHPPHCEWKLELEGCQYFKDNIQLLPSLIYWWPWIIEEWSGYVIKSTNTQCVCTEAYK